MPYVFQEKAQAEADKRLEESKKRQEKLEQEMEEQKKVSSVFDVMNIDNRFKINIHKCC